MNFGDFNISLVVDVFTDAVKTSQGDQYNWGSTSSTAFFDTSIVTGAISEECVLIEGNTGKLLAVSCSSSQKFVCQKGLYLHFVYYVVEEFCTEK